MLNVSSLWSKHPKKHVKICIIDTGYDMMHPDLPNKTVTGWVRNKTCGLNFMTVDWKSDESEDSHGTHVSGIISKIMNYRSESHQYHILHRINEFAPLLWKITTYAHIQILHPFLKI
jgi:subtilisin family serine protease